jgi:hypothetical protein
MSNYKIDVSRTEYEDALHIVKSYEHYANLEKAIKDKRKQECLTLIRHKEADKRDRWLAARM